MFIYILSLPNHPYYTMMHSEFVFSQLNNILKEKYLLGDDNFRIACEVIVRRQHHNFDLVKQYYGIPNNDKNRIKTIKSYITRYRLKQLILSRPSIGFKHRARYRQGK